MRPLSPHDDRLGRLAGHLGAQVALAEHLPIEQADGIVLAVFEALGYTGGIVDTPQRKQMIAPLLPPPVLDS